MSAVNMRVDVVSAEGAIFSGLARFVVLPGELGELGVYPGHTPLLTRVRPGAVRVQDTDGGEAIIVIAGGVLEVQPDVVTVLADTAVRSDELDAVRIDTARRDAEDTLAHSDTSPAVKLQLQQELSFLQAQLSVLHRQQRK